MNFSNNQFTLVIAYLLPGFIALASIAPLFPLLLAWLSPATYSQASLGPPLYVLLAATTLGLIASCVRWILVDHVLHLIGVRPPTWDDRVLPLKLEAFNYLVESHYRYYQFVANSLVAIVSGYVLNRSLGTSQRLNGATDLIAILLCVVLFLAARDALAKYYKRTGQLLSESVTTTKEHNVQRK